MAFHVLGVSLVAGLTLLGPAGQNPAPTPVGGASQPAAAVEQGAGPVAAPAQPPQKPASQKRTAPGAITPDEAASLERIKTAIAKGPGLDLGPIPTPDSPETTADGKPIYRSRAEATLFKMPDFKETLKFGFEPIPPGGRDLYEFNRLVTPPEFRGVAMFTNQEVLKVMALALRNALALKAIRWTAAQTFEVLHERELQKIREEIRTELAAIDAASKKGAAAPPDGTVKKDDAAKGDKPGSPVK